MNPRVTGGRFALMSIPITPQECLRYGRLLGVLTIAYVALGLLSHALMNAGDVMTANLFIPEGECVAIALIYGLRTWPSVLFGQWILEWINHVALSVSLLVSSANVLLLFVAVMLLHSLRFHADLASAKDFLKLASAEAFVLQPLSTFLGMMVLWLSGLSAFYQANLFHIVDYFTVYQAVSQILFVAMVLVLFDAIRYPRGEDFWLLLGCTVSTLGFALYLLYTYGPVWGLSPLHIIMAIYLSLLAMAIVFDILGAVLANLMLLALTKYAVFTGIFPLEPLVDIREQDQHSDIFIVGILLGTGLIGAVQRERNLHMARLREMAIRDPLTGLYNRRFFYETAENEIAKLKRRQVALCLICVDLDDFKEINDRWGHQAGDQALRLWAEVLREQLRAGDLVARIGGDEFAILLETVFTPQQVARKLQHALTQKAHQCGHPPFTASFGATLLRPDDASIDAALQRGDLALYEAKQQGRNSVIVFESLSRP